MSSARAIAAALVAAALASCGRGDARPDTHHAAPDRCGQCHLREYQRARRPPHVGVRPPTCGVCHLQNAWRPSSVKHEWPLTGAHVRADCYACHTGDPAVFEHTPKTCAPCHDDDYRRVRFAGHARFPHTCQDCHTTAAWTPTRPEAEDVPPAPSVAPSRAPVVTPSRAPVVVHAPSRAPVVVPSRAPVVVPAPTPAQHGGTHPESAFPIARGNHTHITCARCHRGSGPDSRDNTDCVQCHPRSRWDPVHDGVGRYPQGSAPANFCVSCHRHGTRSRR